MSHPNSGQINLDEQLDTILDEYVNGRGIKFPVFNQEMSSYWNMSRDYIESLSREDREVIAIQLAQQALYVQRLLNREKARVSYCNATLSHVCAGEWENYKHIWKDEMKIAVISRENSVARKLLEIKNHAQIRMVELEGITPIIKHLSDILIKSAYGKD